MHRKKNAPAKGIVKIDEKPLLEKNEVLLFCLFILGIFCLVKEIDIYRLTFISPILPMSIFFVTGVIASILSKNIISYGNNFISIVCFWGYNLFAWGSIMTYLFMLLNFSFTENNLTVFSNAYHQGDTGHLGKGRYGCGKPWVEIIYKGFRKQMIFPCDSAVNKYNSIQISVSTGFAGYDIIKKLSLYNK